MSEFTNKYEKRVQQLKNYIIGLLNDANGTDLLKKHDILETQFTEMDVVMALDLVIPELENLDKLKIVSNKLFNILYKNLLGQAKPKYPKNNIISVLIDDNKGVSAELADMRPLIKELNKMPSRELILEIKKCLKKIQQFSEHYIVMQNIVFSELEKHFKYFRCVKLMWAFHDDIVQHINDTLALLNDKSFDLKSFNRLSSKIYFNVSTIIFREENVLFPLMYLHLTEESFNNMNNQLPEFNLKYAHTKQLKNTSKKLGKIENAQVHLSTGTLSLEQLELIFAHLPVDMTFVDENDEVRYFSNPKHRIFPRTTGIIGRKVQNCHPHDSVHIVNKIVESFKKGEKDEAAFWIKMGEKFVLIKYFAVRDADNNYKGVLEVSQEVSEIRNLQGEKRLLDW